MVDVSGGLAMSISTQRLASLHTSAIDARNGYREAVAKAEGKGLTPLFTEAANLHDKHAAELAGLLTERGEAPDGDGSFMSLVHEGIMDMRSLFGGLDESVLPGLIDGEKRNIASYDEAVEEARGDAKQGLLRQQRTALSTFVDKMRSMRPQN
jgi:uncharacterized protein (TIGR02284 family)